MALTRLQRKKAPVSSDRMTLLREMVESELHTRPTASNKLLPKLPEFPLRVDSDQLRRWYNCWMCNRYKGPNLSGLDPDRVQDEPTNLFHPRRDRWSDHFYFQDELILGKTTKGRATVHVLNMNHELNRMLRQHLIENGLYPPTHYQP